MVLDWVKLLQIKKLLFAAKNISLHGLSLLTTTNVTKAIASINSLSHQAKAWCYSHTEKHKNHSEPHAITIITRDYEEAVNICSTNFLK